MLITDSLFYNNGSNANNVTIDSSCVTEQNPLLTDPANGNFTLQPGSPAMNSGFDFSKIGLSGTYRNNIGIDQSKYLSFGYIRMH